MPKSFKLNNFNISFSYIIAYTRAVFLNPIICNFVVTFFRYDVPMSYAVKMSRFVYETKRKQKETSEFLFQ